MRGMELSNEEAEILPSLFLLTSKPVIYVANVDEEGLIDDNDMVKAVFAAAKAENAEALKICADEKAQFLSEMGIGESGLDRLVKACYRLLGLISYLTAGPKEVRAWTIENGTKAPQAAGKIHSDFERGFIRAEVVHYDTLMENGTMQACKEKGLIRSEGKDYVMRDGDIVLFRFNV